MSSRQIVFQYPIPPSGKPHASKSHAEDSTWDGDQTRQSSAFQRDANKFQMIGIHWR